MRPIGIRYWQRSAITAAAVKASGQSGKCAREVGRGAEPGVAAGQRARGREAGSRLPASCSADGTEQPVPGPVLRVGEGDGVGHHGGEAQPPRGGEDPVALAARHQLGVEVGGSAQCANLLEERNGTGEEHEAASVSGNDLRQRCCPAVAASLPPGLPTPLFCLTP